MSGIMTAAAGAVGNSPASAILLPANITSQGIGTREATFRLHSDGTVYYGDNSTFVPQYAWRQSGASADYEARVTINYGPISGTSVVWLPLSTTRDWSISDTTGGFEDENGQIEVQIRDVATSTVLATAIVNLLANQV